VTASHTDPTQQHAGDASPVPILRCDGLGVTLHGSGGAQRILDGVDLSIHDGEFVSVLGQSGSGKTTLLRVLGGLLPATTGTVRHGDNEFSGPVAGLITVFQDYTQSLLPWRSVRRNVALGVESKMSKAEATERVDEALEMVGLTDRADEHPARLSGGMQQRVQIARALAMRPSVMLMDEPFGALDAMTRASLQDQLQEVQHVTHTTIVFVTHDVEEAVYLSDRVLILQDKPASIGVTLEVGLERPRHQLRTKEGPLYLELRHRIYQALGHEVAE
jgi:NitT/TauT family transport system ATP-binding protein